MRSHPLVKIIKEYNNLEQFIAEVSTTDYDRQSSVKNRESWAGSVDFEDAVNQARTGLNLDYIETVVSASEKLKSHIIAPVYDVSGAVVDVSMYLTGEPECMIDYQMTETTRYTTLVVNISEMSDISAEQMNNKAIAIACLIDELESNGVRVELIVVGYTHLNKIVANELIQARVKIKSHMEKLSVSQLTGALAPSMFRRLMFAFIEKFWKHGTVPGGYGKLDMKPEIEGVYMKGATEGATLNTLDDARKYVERYLKEILENN